MPGYADRIRQHDETALEVVRSTFLTRRIKLYPFGGELSPSLQKDLRSLGNGTSRMLRYRPDQVAVIPGKRSLLLEIKSESDGSPNFAVELNAWEAAKMWNRDSRHVLYVFVDLKVGSVYAAWPENLTPARIFVPRTGDLGRIAAYPGIPVRKIVTRRGSGTTFFLVPKAKLRPLDAALRDI